MAGVLDVGPQERGVQQVDHAETAARHLVFVRRADAAAGGADLLPAGRALRSQFDHPVVGEDHLRTVGDEQLAVDIDSEFAELANLLQKGHRVEHHAVPDHASAIGAKHAAGNKLQDEFLPTDNDRMPGIVATRIARHDGEPFRENIDDLAFAFIAPLGADYYRRLSSHEIP